MLSRTRPFNSLTIVLASIALSMAAIVLIVGWIGGSDITVSFVPDAPSMARTSAICMIMLCGSMMLFASNKIAANALRASAVLCGLVAVANMFLIFFDSSNGIESLLWPGVSDGVKDRMDLGASFNFILASFLIFVIPSAKSYRILFVSLATLGLGLCLTTLISYTLRVPEIYQYGTLTTMSLPTSLCFALIYIAIMLSRKDIGWIYLILGNRDSAKLSRRILLWVVIFDLAFGLTIPIGVTTGLYSVELSFSFLVIANIVTLVIAVLINTQIVNRSQEDLDRFAGVMKSVSQGVLIADRDRRILTCNPAFTRITGYEESEIVGQTCRFMQGVRTSAQTVEEIRSRLDECREFEGEILNYKKGGEEFWNDLTITPRFDEAGNLSGFIGITRDASHRKQAEAYRERFELAARASQDAIFEWNLETHEFWANEAYEAIYGYRPPSHVRLDALEQMSDLKADRGFARRVTQEAIDSGRDRYALDYQFTRSDGSLGHAIVRGFIVRDEAGKALRIIGTSTEVGRLTEAMNALEASEERFRIIADTVSDVLWDRNFDTGEMWVTPGWHDRLKVAIDPSVTYDDFMLKHVDPADRERLERTFAQAIKSDAAEWEIQYGLIGSDGDRIELAVKAAILRHPGGRAFRMLGNARNVTMERRQQEGYSRARALEAVGQLTGGVAHDFNNQLMIIQGNAELLEMSELDEEQAESVSLINQASSSAADLTQRLLSFSRQSHLQTGRIDLTRLIPNTVALLRAGIPESIAIRCELPAGIWQARADSNALEQAIVNLAVNARDAMPAGGDIVIGCENRHISKDMEPFSSELAPGDYVVVSVTDNGEGMSPEVLAKVFEPFFTTKDVGKGTGLGLSTVYGFAKQSDGHVTIYSEPGQGTCINLYLPRFLEAGEAEPQEHAWEDTPLATGQRILLVEDQPQVRAHVEKLLTKLGYDVTVAEHGKAALSLLQRGNEFDLLFTDVIMPGGMNGQQLAEEVRKMDPRMKVLFTSGYPAFAFEHLGFDELDNIKLLRKPYRLVELKAALVDVLDG